MTETFMAVLGIAEDPTTYMLGMPPRVLKAFMAGVPDGLRAAGGTREFLLETFRPIYPSVYCNQITLAYGVGRNYRLPPGPQSVTIVGQVLKAGTQALVAMVGDKLRREDGKLFSITMSTAPGVPPAEAGNFAFDDPSVRWFGSDEFVGLDLWPYLAPRWKITPQRNRWAA